jgi:hypothetical protein
VHPDAGYDSTITRNRFTIWLPRLIAHKGEPARLVRACGRVENQSGRYKLRVQENFAICNRTTHHRGIDAFIALIIVVRRFIREGWTRYWLGRW